MSGLGAGEAQRVLNDRPDSRDVAPEARDFEGPQRGDIALEVLVGSLRLRWEGLDEPLASLVRTGYEGFVADAEGTAHAVTRVVASPRERYLHLTRGEGRSEEARMASRTHESTLTLWSYFFASRFDRGGRAATLAACAATDGDLQQALENHLRFLVATTALSHRGFVLHASGIVKDGRAFVFFGPSGAGKSTAAAHAPSGARLLGDDLVLVERDASGSWRACGVPFRGTFSRGANAAESAPIAMACRLVQANADRLETVPRSVRVAEVLGEMPFLADDAALRDAAAERAHEFVREVDVRRLYLRRGGGYWDLLEGS